MRVRMLPISFVFSRFPRMVRDLAQQSRQADRAENDRRPDRAGQDGAGEDRRSARAPGAQLRRSRHRAVRRRRCAAGKSAHGTCYLHAYHRGSNIAVEISDDGAGLDKERILAKARERGLIGPE